MPTTAKKPKQPKVRPELELNDPRYLRRLARVVSNHPNGAYLHRSATGTTGDVKLTGRAMYSEAEKVVLFTGRLAGGPELVYRVLPDQAGTAFFDGGKGETITASRLES